MLSVIGVKKENSHKCLFVSDEQDYEIEHLFGLDFLRENKMLNPDGKLTESKTKKENFAKKMSKKENRTREIFKGFKPLLEKILKEFSSKITAR